MRSSASFREMDSEFLEQRARLWIEGLLNERLPEAEKLVNILSDGEILLRVGKVLVAGEQPAGALPKAPSTNRLGSRKGYMSYSNADTFIKLCREHGVLDIDLFTPPDLVEGKDFRRVCLTLRSLAKKARSQNAAVPDFDDATKRPGKTAQGEAGSANKVGDILDQFEGRGPPKEDDKDNSKEDAHNGAAPESATADGPSTAAPDLPPGTSPAQPTTPPATLTNPPSIPSNDSLPSASDKMSSRGRDGQRANGAHERSSRAGTAGMRVTENVAAKQQQLLESVSQQYPSSAPQLDLPPKPIMETPPAKQPQKDPQPQPSAAPSQPLTKPQPQPQKQPQPAKDPLPQAPPPSPLPQAPPPADEPLPLAPQKAVKEQVAPPPQAVKEPPTKDIPMVGESGPSGANPGGKPKPEPERSTSAAADEIPEPEKPKRNGIRWLLVGGAAALLATAAIVIPKRTKSLDEEGDGVYRVKKGDTLIKISKRVGKKNWSEIVKLNPEIQNPDLIYPAERIKLRF